jgi:putative PIG3 family NAD(P)H quinone oxidoreductase
MKAILYDQPKAPLYLGDAPEPQLNPGDLLVRVHATALNRADLLQRRGGYAPPPGASPILGLELAGEVVQAADGWQVGDRVMAVVTGGSYAEYAAVPASVAMPIPDSLSYEEAAAIPEAFLTAYLNLFTLGKLQGHESVLIHAGGSGIGTAAIQLARAEGVRYIFTTAGSAEKLVRCQELGANVVINYNKESFLEHVREVTEDKGVEVILDFIGAPYWNDNLAALAYGGRLMLIGFLGGAVGEMNLGALMAKNLTVTSTTLRRTPLPQKIELVEAFSNFGLSRLASRELLPVIDRVFTLEQAEEAHTYMQSNQNFGKIILRVI